MKIVKAGFDFIDVPDARKVLRKIERVGRVCYKSEDKITEESAPKFVKMLIARGHETMLEHYTFSILFTVDRGVSHEIVRHRLAAFAQESTRYCNYSSDKFGQEITVIQPCYLKFFPCGEPCPDEATNGWYASCLQAEENYFYLLDNNCSPQEARAVLPNSLKTEIVVTANLREWRHILKLRTADVAHPQMQEVMRALLDELKNMIPIVFEDINY